MSTNIVEPLNPDERGHPTVPGGVVRPALTFPQWRSNRIATLSSRIRLFISIFTFFLLLVDFTLLWRLSGLWFPFTITKSPWSEELNQHVLFRPLLALMMVPNVYSAVMCWRTGNSKWAPVFLFFLGPFATLYKKSAVVSILSYDHRRATMLTRSFGLLLFCAHDLRLDPSSNDLLLMMTSLGRTTYRFCLVFVMLAHSLHITIISCEFVVMQWLQTFRDPFHTFKLQCFKRGLLCLSFSQFSDAGVILAFMFGANNNVILMLLTLTLCTFLMISSFRANGDLSTLLMGPYQILFSTPLHVPRISSVLLDILNVRRRVISACATASLISIALTVYGSSAPFVDRLLIVAPLAIALAVYVAAYAYAQVLVRRIRSRALPHVAEYRHSAVIDQLLEKTDELKRTSPGKFYDVSSYAIPNFHRIDYMSSQSNLVSEYMAVDRVHNGSSNDIWGSHEVFFFPLAWHFINAMNAKQFLDTNVITPTHPSYAGCTRLFQSLGRNMSSSATAPRVEEVEEGEEDDFTDDDTNDNNDNADARINDSNTPGTNLGDHGTVAPRLTQRIDPHTATIEDIRRSRETFLRNVEDDMRRARDRRNQQEQQEQLEQDQRENRQL